MIVIPSNQLMSRTRNATLELKKINSYKAPRDKVICILNCCKFIFSKSRPFDLNVALKAAQMFLLIFCLSIFSLALIRRSEGNSKGADTFLPILIYVVLRSNPPNLVSNVQYVTRVATGC